MMHQRKYQQGVVAILLLITIAITAVAVLSKNLWGEDGKTYHAKVNRAVLLQAKAALLTYLEVGDLQNTLTDQIGRLPCPNQDGNGRSTTSCGTATDTARGIHSLGLFPWATLGAPVLRDATHQCLWYAVDGAFKENPLTAPINSDSIGSFSVIQLVKNIEPKTAAVTWTYKLLVGNLSTAINNSPDRAVAVIIASGQAGSNQNQSATAGAYTCPLPQVAAGTSTPSAQASTQSFLANTSVVNNQSFGSAPAANTGSPTAATPAAALKTFITADTGQERVNDQVVWITAEEVAAALTKRIARTYANQINQYVKKTGFYPWAATTPGGNCIFGQLQGFVPYTCEVASSVETDTSNGGAHPSVCDSTSRGGCPDISLGGKALLNDPDSWAGQAHYAVSKDCVAKLNNTKDKFGHDRPVLNSGANGADYTQPCSQKTGADRINLGTGANGPAAIILMRGRALAHQSSCVYNRLDISSAINISNCIEDADNAKAIKTAYGLPPASPYSAGLNVVSKPAAAIGSVQYRVPKTTSSNDYMVQLTAN